MEFDRFHRGVKSDLSIALYHRKIALYHRKIAVVEAEQCRTFDCLWLWKLSSLFFNFTFYGCGGSEPHQVDKSEGFTIL